MLVCVVLIRIVNKFIVLVCVVLIRIVNKFIVLVCVVLVCVVLIRIVNISIGELNGERLRDRPDRRLANY